MGTAPCKCDDPLGAACKPPDTWRAAASTTGRAAAQAFLGCPGSAWPLDPAKVARRRQCARLGIGRVGRVACQEPGVARAGLECAGLVEVLERCRDRWPLRADQHAKHRVLQPE